MIGQAPSPRPPWTSPGGWSLASGAVTLLVLAPLVALALAAGQGSSGLWQHLLAYVVPSAVRDTAILLTGVGTLAIVIGAGTAWIVTAHEFPGRGVLEWALLLPLAVPTYIIAFAYLDILHPVGPVQSAIRAVLGIESPREFRLPDLRSMPGCILMLGFVLYPYVYLTARATFAMQAANLFDVARTLGVGRRGVFLRVALPMARPAIAVGASLALLEALNDIGASEFLGVRTLTVTVYTTWITRSDLAGAAQIALTMLAIAVGLVVVERRARSQRRYANDVQHPRPLVPRRVRGLPAVLMLAGGFAPVAAGFVVPTAYLCHAAVARLRFGGFPARIAVEAVNTLALALLATALTVACGLAVAYAVRVGRGRLPAALARTASLGYAVPGTVLAIGVLPVVMGVDTLIDSVAGRWGGPARLWMLGSGLALVYAYVVRFLAVAVGGVEAGFGRVPVSLDEAARTLGASPATRLRRLHVPLIRPSLTTAALLVFVDCMKELPVTLLLRPVSFETLATHLYGEAVRGTYEDGAIAALLIVLVGLVPVVPLARLKRAADAHAPASSTPLASGPI